MTNTETHVSREWTVGGYQVDPANVDHWRPWRNIQISVQLETEVRQALDECLALCAKHVGEESHDAFISRLLIEEAGVNLYGHGKQGSPVHPSKLSFQITEQPPRSGDLHFTLSLEDDLPPFSIDELPDPTFDERLEEVTGRGIRLIRELCRAKIRQVPTDRGGKYMIYEWKKPQHSLTDVGLPEKQLAASEENPS